jgi:hypothetical protein
MRRLLRWWVLTVGLATWPALPAFASHGTPPPPLPPGQAGVLVRLVWLPGPGEVSPDGQVGLQGIELHRAGAAGADGWVRLPALRPEVSVRELMSGQVWVASAPVAAGEFNQVRLRAGGSSEFPIALRLVQGQWSIVTLYVGFPGGPARGPLRLELKRAYPTASP